MLVDAPQTAAATASRRLYQYRIAEFVGFLPQKLRVLAFAMITGHNWHAGLIHEPLGMIFQPHGANSARRWPDEGNVRLGACLRELCILGQEAVSGMNAVGACALCRRDHMVDREIASAGLWPANQIGFVTNARVQRPGIGFGIDRDRPHAEPLGGTRDTTGNFAPVSDED